MEDKDDAIIRKLRIDSSEPVSEIASDLDLPRTTVQERIKKLVQSGVIKRFTLQLDYSKIGKAGYGVHPSLISRGTGVSQKGGRPENC